MGSKWPFWGPRLLKEIDGGQISCFGRSVAVLSCMRPKKASLQIVRGKAAVFFEIASL